MERTGNQYVRGGEYRLDMFGTKMKAVRRGTRQIDGSRDSRIFRLRYRNVMKLYTNCFFSPLLIGLLLLVSCVKVFHEAKVQVLEKSISSGLRFGNFFIIIIFFFFPVVAPAA